MNSTNHSLRTTINTTTRRRKVRPLAIGFVVTIIAVIINHYTFFKTQPILTLDRFDQASTVAEQELIVNSPADSGFDRFFSFLAESVNAFDGFSINAMTRADAAAMSSADTGKEKKIAVVAIDEASLRKVASWPWSRRDFADLLEKVSAGKVVGIDLLLREPDRTSLGRYMDSFVNIYGKLPEFYQEIDPEQLDNDLHLGRAISNLNSVMALFFYNDPGIDGSSEDIKRAYTVEAMFPDGTTATLDDPAVRQAGDVFLSLEKLRASGRGPLGEGFMNLFPNAAGTVRSVPLFIRYIPDPTDKAAGREGILVPSMPLEMVRIGLGCDKYVIELQDRIVTFRDLVATRDAREHNLIEAVSLVDSKTGKKMLHIPVDEFGDLFASTSPSTCNYEVYPAWEVLAGMHDGAFDDKYVLVDITAAGVGNIRASLLSSDSTPGILIHANMLSSMLDRNFMHYSFRNDYLWQQILILVAGIAVTIVLVYGGYYTGLVVCIAVLLLLTVGNYFLFYRRGVVIGMTFPMLSTVLVLVVQFISNHLMMGRDRRFIRRAFSLSVSPTILSYLETHPDRMSALQGEQRNMTVLFSDIRGFTAISEKMTATDLARFLNEYLTPMSDIVMQNLGTVDKFMGDALMAFWNAPTDDPNHARNAARSALAMQTKLGELQKEWSSRGLPELAIGCGINTGPMFAGYMGSEQRKNYTVMGDSVNIASRLEGLNKLYSSNIIISQSTRDQFGNSFLTCVVDKVRDSGRTAPIVIYELLGEGIQDEERYEEVAAFERVFQLYQERDFLSAEALLKELVFISPRPLYDMYLDRLAIYLALPPSASWDGVFTVTRK